MKPEITDNDELNSSEKELDSVITSKIGAITGGAISTLGIALAIGSCLAGYKNSAHRNINLDGVDPKTNAIGYLLGIDAARFCHCAESGTNLMTEPGICNFQGNVGEWDCDEPILIAEEINGKIEHRAFEKFRKPSTVREHIAAQSNCTTGCGGGGGLFLTGIGLGIGAQFARRRKKGKRK